MFSYIHTKNKNKKNILIKKIINSWNIQEHKKASNFILPRSIYFIFFVIITKSTVSFSTASKVSGFSSIFLSLPLQKKKTLFLSLTLKT